MNREREEEELSEEESGWMRGDWYYIEDDDFAKWVRMPSRFALRLSSSTGVSWAGGCYVHLVHVVRFGGFFSFPVFCHDFFALLNTMLKALGADPILCNWNKVLNWFLWRILHIPQQCAQCLLAAAGH